MSAWKVTGDALAATDDIAFCSNFIKESCINAGLLFDKIFTPGTMVGYGSKRLTCIMPFLKLQLHRIICRVPKPCSPSHPFIC